MLEAKLNRKAVRRREREGRRADIRGRGAELEAAGDWLFWKKLSQSGISDRRIYHG